MESAAMKMSMHLKNALLNKTAVDTLLQDISQLADKGGNQHIMKEVSSLLEAVEANEALFESLCEKFIIAEDPVPENEENNAENVEADEADADEVDEINFG